MKNSPIFSLARVENGTVVTGGQDLEAYEVPELIVLASAITFNTATRDMIDAKILGTVDAKQQALDKLQLPQNMLAKAIQLDPELESWAYSQHVIDLSKSKGTPEKPKAKKCGSSKPSTPYGATPSHDKEVPPTMGQGNNYRGAAIGLYIGGSLSIFGGAMLGLGLYMTRMNARDLGDPMPNIELLVVPLVVGGVIGLCMIIPARVLMRKSKRLSSTTALSPWFTGDAAGLSLHAVF